MKILIVAPKLAGIEWTEIPEVAQGNEVTLLHGTVTVAHLEMALKTANTFDAIHFMQHGDYGVLQLSDRSISEQRLALALNNQHNLRFVFLNACNSAGIATTVHNRVGVSVVFHEAPINSKLAERLASEFYNNLAGAISLQRALDDANATVAREAAALGVEFIPAHLINGGMSQSMTDKLERAFATMASQLSDIDTRIEQLEEAVSSMQRRSWWPTVIALLIMLIIAQIGTAIIDILARY